MKLFEYSFYAFVVGLFTLFLTALLFFSYKYEEACNQKNGIIVRTTQGYTCIEAKAVKEIK